jgi:hypothetical protein
MLTGRCFCGAVQIEVEDAFEYSLYCHCSRCRRRTGSAFSVFGGIAIEKVRVRAGEEQVALVGNPHGTHDKRCTRCFACLYSVVREQKYAHVQLGVLESAPSLAPQGHIWVSTKASWYTIGDDLPQFAEFAP